MCCSMCVCVCVVHLSCHSASLSCRQCQADRQEAGGSKHSVRRRQSSSPRGRFANFRILHFIYIFNVSQVVLSLSLPLADIRNLPLQINCQVMAVTSLRPPSLPPLLRLPLFLFINARVNAMISLHSLHACCEIFYAQFMLIWPQFSHKGIRQQLFLSPSSTLPRHQHIFIAFVDIYARFFSHWAEIV